MTPNICARDKAGPTAPGAKPPALSHQHSQQTATSRDGRPYLTLYIHHWICDQHKVAYYFILNYICYFFKERVDYNYFFKREKKSLR